MLDLAATCDHDRRFLKLLSAWASRWHFIISIFIQRYHLQHLWMFCFDGPGSQLFPFFTVVIPCVGFLSWVCATGQFFMYHNEGCHCQECLLVDGVVVYAPRVLDSVLRAAKVVHGTGSAVLCAAGCLQWQTAVAEWQLLTAVCRIKQVTIVVVCMEMGKQLV